jgi:hypothetical protein
VAIALVLIVGIGAIAFHLQATKCPGNTPMSRQQSFEAQLKAAGADDATAAETARILAKDGEYPRTIAEQATVQQAYQQISK